MLVYPKIAHEVIPHQAIFILGCGCDVKNPGPAMLVYPKIAHEVIPHQAIFILGCDVKIPESALRSATWSSHAGLSENRPRSDADPGYFHSLLWL